MQHWTQDKTLSIYGLDSFAEANEKRAALRAQLKTQDVKIKIRRYPLRPNDHSRITFSVLVFQPVRPPLRTPDLVAD
jgi:hypothetical protein